MRFLFTDQDRHVEDEYQDGGMLSEQTGWWYPDGTILIWTKQSIPKQIGVAVHEGIEYILMHKIFRIFKNNRRLFDVLASVSHFIANEFEFVASLGTADQYWGKQDWKMGSNKKNPAYEAYKKGLQMEGERYANG